MTEINKQHIRERLGNLDQIRDLLFGQKMEDYERQFSSCQNRIDRLESQLQQFQSETHNRLTLLQNSLAAEIRSGFDSLEQKIKFLNLTAREKNSKIEGEISYLEQQTSQNLDYYHRDLTAKTDKLQTEIAQLKKQLEASIQTLKQQAYSEIEKEFIAIKDAKVSRTDLAEVLFELCLKLRGNELFSQLKEIELETDLGERVDRDNQERKIA